MPYSLTRLSVWVIIATLPLTILPSLPGSRFDALLMITAGLLLVLRRRGATDLAIIMLIVVWSVSAGRSIGQQITGLSTGPVDAVVRIEQLLPQSERVKVRILQVAGRPVFAPIYALLKAQGEPVPYCAGQRWQMRLRLRPVHARLNEGSFDAQRFALANQTPLTGRILAAALVTPACSWRHRVITASRENYGHLPWQSVISALAFGERGDINRETSQLLRETGTAHLMAISGMHIGLAASLGWAIARLMQLGFAPRWIGYRFPLILSLLAALIYTWLSGGNPPAIRAMLALSAWSLLRLGGICCSNWQVWSMCIGLILFFEPLSILSDSLWLSAVAVAGLLIWFHWFPLPARFMRKKRWLLLRLLHVQFGMFLLLLPIQVVIFHGFSLSALLANLWAIPIITLLTVPLLLCAIIVTPVTSLSQLLWWGADRTLAGTFLPLRALPTAWLDVNTLALWLSGLAWLLILAVRFGGWRTSPLTLVAFTLSLLCFRLNTTRADWRVDMLDVGHGLAVVISRGSQATLYDTGNRWESGDAALSQILPWLKWQGLTLEQVIISHQHLDHMGGLASIQRAFPAARVRSNPGAEGHLPCHRGIVWQWQGLNFRVLWPEEGEKRAGNDHSCVVAVSDGKWRVLLTGDIESKTEHHLVRFYPAELPADVLQVAHHGSGTSSSPPFLRAVSARVALASVARYSAWRLPASRVMMRYKQNRYQWYDTAVEGQVSIHFFAENWFVKGLRAQIMPRWYHQWFGVPRYSR
ncbi:ComEC family protein [Erwinia sp. ErVv1]|uniref:ComEC family protein n=1 Tax=Erwinia sp. ErVv1 TaxID=1603299 RepID=UPI0008368792|nr:ComEC family protein [Erwinia sp. ErVv1]